MEARVYDFGIGDREREKSRAGKPARLKVRLK